MNTFRALAVAVIVVLVTVCALFSLSAHTRADEAARAVTSASHLDFAPTPDDEDGRDMSQGAVDLFGNDVSDAVAEYRLDATGSLYEVHSPQTEIPKLGSPKS